KSDNTYFTDFIHQNYTHDAGLAVLATVGQGTEWLSLAEEISNGLIQANVSGETVPFMVNHVVPDGDAYFRSNSVAMCAYALGFYIEKYPTAENISEVALTLYDLLTWLLNRRNEDGL